MTLNGPLDRGGAKRGDLHAVPKTSDLATDQAGSTGNLAMRLEVWEVPGITVPLPQALTGNWAWLLFHGDGTLIAYSDGYETRSACVAAAKRIGLPINIVE